MRALTMTAILMSLGTVIAAAEAPPAPKRGSEQQPGSIDPRYTCELGRAGVFVISMRQAARTMRLQAVNGAPPIQGVC